jgi:hypothetical protein
VVSLQKAFFKEKKSVEHSQCASICAGQDKKEKFCCAICSFFQSIGSYGNPKNINPPALYLAAKPTPQGLYNVNKP